jgi:hypothetical protein
MYPDEGGEKNVRYAGFKRQIKRDTFPGYIIG